MNTKLLILSFLGIFLLGGVVVWYHEFGVEMVSKKQNVTPRVVKLFQVGVSQYNTGTSYPGRVQPEKHAELFFRVSGPVIQQELKMGQTFEKGDVLMRIDPRDYEREVERITMEVNVLKADLDLANSDFLRQKQLHEKKAISETVFDAARAKKASLESQVDVKNAQLKVAIDKRDDTVLYAPFHGTVTDIKIEEFEIAQANVPVLQFDDLRTMEIKVNLPAGNLPSVSLYDGTDVYKDKKFKVTFPGRGNREFFAHITEFKPSAAAATETYELILTMDQPQDFVVLPGMTAEVHHLPNLRLTSEHEKIRLPFAAVFHRDGKACVWVYQAESSTVTLREVILGQPTQGNFISVDSHLMTGEWVVAAGGDWLNEGEKVRPLNAEKLK